MTTRTSKRTVTFERPFVLPSFDSELPAGPYEVETDEELLQGISFPAYRRVLTLLRLHPEPGHPHLARTLTVNPNDLDAALERDRAAAAIATEPNSDVQMQPGEQHQVEGTFAPAPSGAQEPHLDEVMLDPIVRSVMGSDRVSEAALAVRSAQAAPEGTTGQRLTAADRQAVERAEDEGMIIRSR